jgi:apolipoprotein N-acyltransferase
MNERRTRVALAIAGGLLLAIAFPKINVAGLAWLAPGVILASGFGADGRRAFRLGYLAGLVHFLCSLYWLLNMPVFKLFPFLAWAGLAAFLSLYPAAWVWLCWRAYPVPLRSGTDGLTGPMEQFLEASWPQRMLWTASCAALWVAWEMIQARLFTGFPWNYLGASQYRMVPLLQLASGAGVYGVSFLVCWFGVSTLSASVLVLRRSQQPRRWIGDLAPALLVAISLVMFGFREVAEASIAAAAAARAAAINSASNSAPATAVLHIGLVQPSIPQRWVWSSEDQARRFQQVLQLSESALTNQPPPQLLVWPEAATPGYLRWDTNTYLPISNLVARHHVWLVLGADDASPRRDEPDPFRYDSYNSSFLVSPEGELRRNYRKRRLVIFGEYIPFHQWIPAFERWTGMYSFTPGREAVPFRIPELHATTSVLICFEDTFPHHTREYVDEDTDFLLNLTNNGWFGESAAQWQHAANAVFRAVENRCPLVRCANNGISCWVDEWGRIHDLYFPDGTDVYGVGVKRVEVPLLNGRKREPTFYHRYGDLFGWSCVLWSALLVGWSFLRERNRENSHA